MMLALVLAVCGLDAPLNESIVEYARSRLGQKVGNGECTTLAVEALRHGGAARPNPVLGIWGEEVKSFRDLQPGDILQFENARFVKQYRADNGAVITYTYDFPHHTAIVSRVRKKGSRPLLTILHQNIDVGESSDEERRIVKEWTLDMAVKRAGTVRAYRPVSRAAALESREVESNPRNRANLR